MWPFFVINILCVLVAIGVLIQRYCAKTVPWIVRLATGYAWLVSFSIVALVPIDVWTTLSNRPDSSSLGVMWDVSYWSTQALTWLILPFFQVYADAGDFTAGARSITSLKENAILYGSAGAAGVVGIILLVIFRHDLLKDPSTLAALGMALSNTFGLIAGILLLGYGLVEIPRHIWKSNPSQLLKWCAHRSGRYAEAVIKTTAELETVVTIICANERQMPRRDPLRPYMEIISKFAEEESPVKPSEVARQTFDIEQLSADDLEYNYDKAGLAALRRRLQRAISEHKAAHTQYEEAIVQAFEQEEICKALQNGEYEPRSGAVNLWTRGVWYYKCMLRPYAHKVASVLLLITTLAIIWSEATIFTGTTPDLSPFSQLILAAREGEFSTQLLTLLPLAYVCACTYFALFHLSAFDYNKLIPRASTGAALMQNGSLMCRFAAPTCWNFLHMIHMTESVNGRDTLFTQKMGSMGTVLPFLGAHLNVYLPVILAVHCGMVYFRIWDRLVGACVSSKFKFTEDDVEDEYTEKGRALIRKEQEARLNGFPIGQILHSQYVDLEFPSLAGARKSKLGQKKSWFSFGGDKAAPGGGGGNGTSRASGLDGGGGGGGGGKKSNYWSSSKGDKKYGSTEELNNPKSSLLSSLMNNRYSTQSPPSLDDGSGGSSAGGAAGRGGLDGIFAEVNNGAAATRVTGASAVSAAGSNFRRGGAEHVDEAASEAQPMLGTWGKWRK